MPGQRSLFHAFFLLVGLWALICDAVPTSVKFVYRADTRAPAEIQKMGGFTTKGQSAPGSVTQDVSLWNHVKGDAKGFSKQNDGYVSTSWDSAAADGWIVTMLKGKGYVYKIAVAPNLIDCEGTLGKYYDLWKPEKEFAALGGIKFDQIVSWTPFPNGKKGKEETNKSYNAKKYKGLRVGGVQPQLAAFPAGHEAWGLDPWKKYAGACKAKKDVEVRAVCTPKQTPFQAAQAYYASLKL